MRHNRKLESRFLEMGKELREEEEGRESEIWLKYVTCMYQFPKMNITVLHYSCTNNTYLCWHKLFKYHISSQDKMKGLNKAGTYCHPDSCKFRAQIIIKFMARTHYCKCLLPTKSLVWKRHWYLWTTAGTSDKYFSVLHSWGLVFVTTACQHLATSPACRRSWSLHLGVLSTILVPDTVKQTS